MRLAIATTAVAAPMGAQVYQEEIASRAQSALDATSTDPRWDVSRVIVRSLRAPLAGNRRLPLGRLSTASARTRGLVGRALYPRGAVVHRMDLLLPPSPGPDVVTIHDVVAWKYADESPPLPAAAEEARRAAAVICVSAFSAQEAVDLLGVRDPVVVHNGVDERFLDAAPAEPSVLRSLGVTGSFVLHAGGASRRKNLAALAGAWPAIHAARPDLTLVLSGPEHAERTRLFARLPGTCMVGRVPDHTVPGLIAAARAVVVPSLYEGFGLPALEAMAARVPVVAAATSALPEVVGDGGILVRPTAEALVEGVLFAVSGDREVANLVRRGRARAGQFTWERSALEHARVWRSVAT